MRDRITGGGHVAELVAALDDLLAQTVDRDRKCGIGLSEGEDEARERALRAITRTVAP